ncbi:MAG: hypothetical protein WA908_01500 [Pontixanthobacter sp.]
MNAPADINVKRAEALGELNDTCSALYGLASLLNDSEAPPPGHQLSAIVQSVADRFDAAIALLDR